MARYRFAFFIARCCQDMSCWRSWAFFSLLEALSVGRFLKEEESNRQRMNGYLYKNGGPYVLLFFSFSLSAVHNRSYPEMLSLSCQAVQRRLDGSRQPVCLFCFLLSWIVMTLWIAFDSRRQLISGQERPSRDPLWAAGNCARHEISVCAPWMIC